MFFFLKKIQGNKVIIELFWLIAAKGVNYWITKQFSTIIV